MTSYLDGLFGLSGKVVVVTGGGTGIGRGLAVGLARAGASVAVLARRKDKLQDCVSEIESFGGKGLAVSADLTDESSLEAALAEITQTLGAVTTLVNNAGADSPHNLLHTKTEDFQRTMDVNMIGPWRISSALVNEWRASGLQGSIINVASITGIAPQKGLAAYGISKAAVLHLTRIMALEWAQFGVRINSLAPGYFLTDMTEDFLLSPLGEKITARIPMRRVGNISELVGATIYLASDASAYTTGTTLAVDGGHLVRSL